MATLLFLYVVDGRLGADEQQRPILYCPTQLCCKYASGDLSEALCAIHAPLDQFEAVIEETIIRNEDIHGERYDEDGIEFVPVPYRGQGTTLLLVTAAQLLTVDWGRLSEDPHGKLCKGAAWAYLAALPGETQVVVHLSY